jgi:uncharacterized caspase-like protein
MRRWTGLFFALCALILHTAPAQAAGRFALVIGNSAYSDRPLKNPANDARDVARALEGLGFAVQLKTDAKLREMEDAIRDFGVQLKRGGVGLFYYAGHGVQVQGVNYLVPIGARMATESDAKYECVDAGRVLGKMEDAGNELNLVILDACRNNPFARGFRSLDQGLARMDAPTGSLVAYATAPNTTASDGGGRNGIYTKYLLQNIGTPGITIEEVFKRVRIGVMNETKRKQVPWESSSISGYLFLAGGQPQGYAAAGASQVAAAQAAAREQKLREYIAGLESEKRQLELEKADLLRSRQQLDTADAQRLKSQQAPQEQRLKDQLAIVEAERRKLEQERAELAAARKQADEAKRQAAKQAASSPAPSVQVASAGPLPGLAKPPAPQAYEDRGVILQRLAGVWRLETDGVNPLPMLALKPGGDTLYGTLRGDPNLVDRMTITGLAMEAGSLHLRLSIEPPQPPRRPFREPSPFPRAVMRAHQVTKVIECVGNLRATLDGDIPLTCRRVDQWAQVSGRREEVSGRMVRASVNAGW